MFSQRIRIISIPVIVLCFSGVVLAEDKDSWIGRGDNTKQYYLQDVGPKNSVIFRSSKKLFEITEPYQNYFGTQVSDMSQEIDEWVSDRIAFDDAQSSRFEVTLKNRYETASQTYSMQVSFRFKLVLPNTQKRFHLMIESAKNGLTHDENGTGAVPTASNAINGQDDSLQAVLRSHFLESEHFKLSLDLGGSFQGITPDPVAGIRAETDFLHTSEHKNILVQKLYWQRLKGKVFDNLYRHDWRLNNYKLVRFETRGIWWDTDEFVEVSQTFSLYDKINIHRFFTYSISGNWTNQTAGFHNVNYGVGFAWRERAYKKLVYVELNPYLTYRNDFVKHQYVLEPSIALNFQFHFFKPKP